MRLAVPDVIPPASQLEVKAAVGFWFGTDEPALRAIVHMIALALVASVVAVSPP